MGLSDARATVVVTTPETAAAVVAILETARRLAIDVPAVLTTDARVYAALQRLACEVETTISAADHARAQWS